MTAKRWVRETVVELLVQYLEASFSASRGADRFRAETTDEARATAKQAMGDAHDTQDAALTKLRLITNRAMVEAAFALHAADHGFVNVATTTPPCTDEKLRRAREDLWRARHRFVAAGKRVVGLPRQQSRVRIAQVDERIQSEHQLDSR